MLILAHLEHASRGLDCESATKRDPTSDRPQLLDTLKEILFRVGSRSAPVALATSSTVAPSAKRSLVQEPPAAKVAKTNKRTKAAPDRHQRALLLPVSGGRKGSMKPATEPRTVAAQKSQEGLTMIAKSDHQETAIPFEERARGS
jgi:hypothetical protein